MLSRACSRQDAGGDPGSGQDGGGDLDTVVHLLSEEFERAICC